MEDVLESSWFVQAAEKIVRERVPLRQAAAELNIPISASEAEKIYKSDAFQKILRTERTKYHREIANTPGRDKSSAIGLMSFLIERLIEEGEYDKAVAALEKLMKAEGWTGQEGNVNVFAGLSAKEYADLLKEIPKEDERKSKPSKGSPPESVQ